MTVSADRSEADGDLRYQAVCSRDRRFDGIFYTGVRTTGIYCRPSCPAVTPKRQNVDFYLSPAAAQQAGFRACRRCLPDATPGSPEWDLVADTGSRAMRLIADGVVEREGVDGLAERLGYSSRQVNRLVTAAWGAGPLALARARRAQSARILVEGTDLSMTEIAYAAGFSSIRQFNDTVREVYGATPSELRGRPASTGAPHGALDLRLAVREPFAAAHLLDYLAVRAVPGVEHAADGHYERTLALPHGSAVIRIELLDRPVGIVPARLWLSDLRDLAPAVERTRRLIDADADPIAIDLALSQEPVFASSVATVPGLRVPGHVDGAELAVRAVIGQQISLAAARTHAGRLTQRLGESFSTDDSDGPVVDRLFPTAAAIAALEPENLPMPRARGRALIGLMAAISDGRIALDGSRDRSAVRADLVSLPGIGPWTADYVAMRVLGDPDVFLPTDIGVRDGARALGLELPDAIAAADRVRPWRSYALMHLWLAAADPHRRPKEN